MSKDPVCGMTVGDDTPYESTHEAQTFRFCSPTCKTKFDQDRDRYAAAVASESLREGRP